MNISYTVANLPSESFKSETRSTKSYVSSTNRVLECLEDAGGSSLTAEDISEQTGLEAERITHILHKLSTVSVESRCVFEDSSEDGSYFHTEPVVDRLVIGF